MPLLLQAIKHPRIALCLAGVVFQDDTLQKFRDSSLQLFASLCSTIDLGEWRSWSNSLFSKQIRQVARTRSWFSLLEVATATSRRHTAYLP